MFIKTKSALKWVPGTGGFTVAEVLIASTIACILGGILGAMAVYTVSSFKAIANYSTNEQQSRAAADWLSRDIRQAATVSQTATNNLILGITNKVTSYTVTYAFDVIGHSLTRQATNQTKVLLRDCLKARFTIYQENGTGAGYGQFVPGTNGAKLVGYFWHCGTTNGDGTVNTTDAQSAMVVMRN